MEKTNQLIREVQAILFYKNEPIGVKELARILEVSEADVTDSLQKLSQSLAETGVVLVSNNNEYSLATSPTVSTTIEKVVKDELNRDLSPASLETLSIIVYKGVVSRKEIEYIRGVNSTFSLRALLLRGLIEKQSSQLDERIYLYKPTTDLLLHLGIRSIEELPEWGSIRKEMEKVEEVVKEEEI